MPRSDELENLVRIGTLREEPVRDAEIAGLVGSGTSRLTDARRPELSLESRFDVAAATRVRDALAAPPQGA